MMSTRIEQIALEKLVPHPGNPNRMSRSNFNKLIRNIEQTGRYEPLVVRPCPGRRGFFQIINGHHRCEALRRLGRDRAEAVVWDLDEGQTDLLLATLNRLGGRDTLEKKRTLLQRLSTRLPIRTLATLVPQTRRQLERLTSHRPLLPVPTVFFVDAAQKQEIEEAILRAVAGLPQDHTRAARRATGLMCIVRFFLDCDRQVTRAENDPMPVAALTA
jgi:hypothetical protein